MVSLIREFACAMDHTPTVVYVCNTVLVSLAYTYNRSDLFALSSLGMYVYMAKREALPFIKISLSVGNVCVKCHVSLLDV